MTAVPSLGAAETPAAIGDRRGMRRIYQSAALAVLLVAAALFPLLFTNQQAASIAFYTLISITAVSAWNIFSGYSGYISLGHAVFFGTGAYAAGLLAQDFKITGGGELWLLIPGGLAAAIVAVPFGLMALRVRRHTFVVITIAFFFIFQLLAYDLAFTHGTIGLNSPFLLWDPVTFDTRFYYLALLLAILTIALSWLVRGSRFGLQLRAIRDDEDRAAGLGVRATAVKLTAFVITAALTGIAGSLWFFFIGQVQPDTGFDPNLDLLWALMAFLGGLGTVAGPALGALIVAPTNSYITQSSSSDWLGLILFGALFLAVVLFLPRGLLPTIRDKITQWRTRNTAVSLSSGRAGQPAPDAARPAGEKPTEVIR